MAEKTLEVPIVIPALNPDQRLCEFVSALQNAGFQEILVVNDGSSTTANAVFQKLAEFSACRILHHQQNSGKGASLKSAFADLLERYPGLPGCVTADADGQHLPEDVIRVATALQSQPNALILGERDFKNSQIPWKSHIGHVVIQFAFHYATGTKLKDSQSGLRGIPATLMKTASALPGNRFEFETIFLKHAIQQKFPIVSVPVAAIYENKNAGTHFQAFYDSILILKALFRKHT